MSKLLQMQISGVRSFQPNHRQTIRFENPLTLIVGFNGSGKTTIIECLKFAFTGMQPPNTKVGGAFVHDPKMKNETEVRAMVKVEFTSAEGARLVVARRLQLTVKKLSRSLKSLEGSLLMAKNGEKLAISSRVAELDLLLPQYLGVSTAVLDNVIFCHQDESLWPLSDASTLKKRFDEIFEAQKYTKAIENIKQIRKKHNEELAKFKLLEEHARGDKDRALSSQKKAERLQKDIELLRDQVENLERRISNARNLADEAWRKGEDHAKILGTLQGKRIEARSKQSTIESLQAHIVEVTESDEWLTRVLEQFEARQAELKDQMRRQQEQYLDYQDNKKNLSKEREDKVKLKGKYEQEKEEHERQLVRRKDMVKEVAAKHRIRGFNDVDDERLVEEFLFKINKISKDQKIALDRAKLEHATERRDAQTLVNKLTERKAALQDNKINIKRQIDSNDRDARDFQRKTDEIRVDEGSKAVVESRIDDLNAKLNAAQEIARTAEWDKKLQEANFELGSNEEVHARLNDEIVQSTKRAGELARLSHLKQELKERQRSLETLLKTHSDRISKLIGQSWNATTIESVHQDALADAKSESSVVEQKRDSVGKDLELLQHKQTIARADLSQKKARADKHEKQICAVVEDGPDGYEKALEEAESETQKARASSESCGALHEYFETVLKTAQTQRCCRTCLRAFKADPSDPQLEQFKIRIKGLVDKALTEVEEINVKEVEAYYKRVSDLGMVVESWNTLTRTEIPALEKDLANLSEQREKLVAQLEKHDKIVEQHQEKRRDIDSMTRTVTSIATCDSDIKSLTIQLEELTAKQSQNSVDRTLEDIREEMSLTSEKSRTMQKLIASLRTEQEQSRISLSTLEIELRDLKGELNTVRYQLDKKASLAARVEEFRASNQKHRENLDILDSDIENLGPEILTAKSEYDDIDQRTSERERDMSNEQSRLSESVNGLELLNGQIRSYVDRDGPAQLSRINRELSRVEHEMNTVQSEEIRVTREINKVQEEIRDSEATRRRYSDNLLYRRETRALSRLNEEIDELADHTAEADRDRFQEESKKHTHEYNALSAKQSGLMGEMKSKDAQLGELLDDYNTNLKDAPRRYKEAHIKVEATKAAVEDLGRYGGALDKAIMKYHGLKMEEINSIIEELWRKTYRGSDVDTIMIRADNEMGRGNRSYNYRVVMVKRDAEMDMRGRCSAGQKVLASIIIRLALAECFSDKCGIIALDEPTTNLDRDNIVSLARSLNDIIRDRSAQSNFQLLVITHDEEFLREMNCGEFTDNYYRISRDTTADSVIERQRIAEVL
ncbi:DNA repair protein RAD50 [Exophiala aquamarina CBS 119918]|uniref:DNA repair protein RAD50 n=1 Tax=Exophiala aquamarina CBS 119918 TaxID=1182545 RepID=A0A072P8V7_9EURO|nr:DNA repair protein RAD50 [Exophiala aquamarina CBS 119918]KEF56261.1 DNA repair protein RAD50 [Exophiala aquamarina CBS 119918]